jgi:hypothetical protein
MWVLLMLLGVTLVSESAGVILMLTGHGANSNLFTVPLLIVGIAVAFDMYQVHMYGKESYFLTKRD